MKKTYNKLVRDKIPEIIENDNKKCTISILNKEEMLIELDKKLQEEVKEYLESKEIEELADIMEVIEGILIANGSTMDKLNYIKSKKKESRGGFQKNLFLIDVEE